MLKIFIKQLWLLMIVGSIFSLNAYAAADPVCLVRLQANDLDCSAGSNCSNDASCQCEALIASGGVKCNAAPCNQHPICTAFPCVADDSACLVEHLRKYAGCYPSVCYTKYPSKANDVTYLDNPFYNQATCNKCTPIVAAMCSPRFGSINVHLPATKCNNNGRGLLNQPIRAAACRGPSGAFDAQAKECVLNNLILTGCKKSICIDHSIAPYNDRLRYEPNPDYNVAKCTQCNQSLSQYCAEFGTINVHLPATQCSQAVSAFINAIRYAKDSDGDGIADHIDNCPYVYNPMTFNKNTGQNWQEDNDSDGIGCACDPGDTCVLYPGCGQKGLYCVMPKPQQPSQLRKPRSQNVPQKVTN